MRLAFRLGTRSARRTACTWCGRPEGVGKRLTVGAAPFAFGSAVAPVARCLYRRGRAPGRTLVADRARTKLDNPGVGMHVHDVHVGMHVPHGSYKTDTGRQTPIPVPHRVLTVQRILRILHDATRSYCFPHSHTTSRTTATTKVRCRGTFQNHTAGKSERKRPFGHP